jgi:hypothetical protein
MTDEPIPNEAAEPPGDAAPSGVTKSNVPPPLPNGAVGDQERASSDDDDVDVVVDKTDMSAVGDDGQVFGG